MPTDPERDPIITNDALTPGGDTKKVFSGGKLALVMNTIKRNML